MNLGRLAGCAAVALMAASCGEATAPSVSVKMTYAIETCQSALKKRLRDPDSAKFADEVAKEGWAPDSQRDPELDYAPDRGDTYFNVTGNVNAKNAFGGYTGMRPYTCDSVVGRNGATQSRARTAD
ncbi:hypothetical protein [Mycobacteroides chelonae]|uniref:hypothetical protein n=1 Tax=Mycobacteroides chelonae TaxID=1774 RepID=UPI001E3FCE9F|nr:hypothetical protein [Mycobacteroides chelonae]